MAGAVFGLVQQQRGPTNLETALERQVVELEETIIKLRERADRRGAEIEFKTSQWRDANNALAADVERLESELLASNTAKNRIIVGLELALSEARAENADSRVDQQ